MDDEAQMYRWMFGNFIDFFRGRLSKEQIRQLNDIPGGRWHWMNHIAREEGIRSAKAMCELTGEIRMVADEVTTEQIIADIRAGRPLGSATHGAARPAEPTGGYKKKK